MNDAAIGLIIGALAVLAGFMVGWLTDRRR